MYRVSEYDNKRYDLQYRPRNDPDLTAGKSLQAGKGTKPLVLITGESALIGELPKTGKHSLGRIADRARVTRQDEGVISKAAVVACASFPPVQGGVDHGISTRLGLVCVSERVDPTDHRRGGQAVARVARGSVFDIQHARQRLAVTRPATTVLEKIVGLRRAGG